MFTKKSMIVVVIVLVVGIFIGMCVEHARVMSILNDMEAMPVIEMESEYGEIPLEVLN